MTDAELVQTLKLISFARPSIAMLAEAAGVSREAVYLIMRQERVSPALKEKLERALGIAEKRGYHIPRVTV